MIKLKTPEEYGQLGDDIKSLIIQIQQDTVESIIDNLNNINITSVQEHNNTISSKYPVKKTLKRGYLKNMTISLQSTYVEDLIKNNQSVEILCEEPGFKGTSIYTPEELADPEWKNPTIFEDKFKDGTYQLWVYKWKNI